MGLLRENIILYTTRALTLLLSVVASLLVVRLLPPSDYGLYQFATRKLYIYLSAPVFIASYWAYRYAALGVEGSVEAYLIVLAVTTIVGILVGSSIMHAITPALQVTVIVFLAACSVTAVALRNIQSVLLAVNIKRASLAGVVRTVLYTASVLVLWRLRELNLLTVSLACITSSLIGSAIAVYKLVSRRVCWRCLHEWLRGSWVPFLLWIASLIGGIDALVVALLAGQEYIAAYFAISLLLRFTADITIWSLSRTQAYILETNDYTTTFRAARAMLVLHAFIAGYAAANPLQVTAFAGSKYLSYAYALQPITLLHVLWPLYVLASQVMTGLDRSRASEIGRVLRLHPLIALTVNALNTGVLTALLLARIDPLISWSLASLTATIAGLTLILLEAVPRVVAKQLVREAVIPALGFYALSYVYSEFVARKVYSTSFIENVSLFAVNASLSFIPYLVTIMALDDYLRSLVYRLAGITTRLVKRYTR